MSLRATIKISAMLALGLALGLGCSDDDTGDDKDVKADAAVPDITAPDLMKPDIVDPKQKPKVIKMIPNNGFANGGKTGSGTPVVFNGENFQKPATVYIDGKPQSTYPVVNSKVSMSFLMPPNPDDQTKAQKVSVMLYMGSQFSNFVDFQYHVTKQMTDDFKGSVLTKTSNAYADFKSDSYEAKVYFKGITDKGSSRSSKLKVEIGYGTVGKDPGTQPGFMWSKASWARVDTTDSKYHVYEATLKVPLVQTYDVAFRFSHDKDGYGSFGEYVYADLDESDKTYTTAKASKIVATQAPVGYCLDSTDCITQGLNQVCKVNTSNKKLNRCVQCLVSTDCTKFKMALGPTCSSNKCICKTDTDCSTNKNPNGYVCTSSKELGVHCGCKTDKNCPLKTKCYKPGVCQ